MFEVFSGARPRSARVRARASTEPNSTWRSTAQSRRRRRKQPAARRTTRRQSSTIPTAGPHAVADPKRASSGDGTARRARRSAATRWAAATGAPRAGRSRLSTPRAILRAGMGRRGRPDRSGASGAVATRARRRGRPRPLGLRAAARARRRPRPGRARRSRNRNRLGGRRPTPNRRRDRASRHRASRRSSSRRRASPIRARRWPKPPPRPTPPRGSPTSTRRRRATANCATN